METDKKARAQVNAQRVMEGWSGRNRCSMVMGWVAAEMRRENQFVELGYKHEKEFWVVRGIKESTWYKMVGIAECFAKASEEDFLAMKVDNAEKLCKIDEESRLLPELLKAAAEETTAQFEIRLAIFKAVKAGLPPGAGRITQKFRVSVHQAKVILDGLHCWMAEHQIEDEGYALEMLVAEYTGRLTLVGYYKESIGRLARAAHACADANLREELYSMVTEMSEALDIVIGESLHKAMEQQVAA